MATERFNTLAIAASRRDCQRSRIFEAMRENFRGSPLAITDTAALSDAVYEAGVEFLDKMDQRSHQFNPRSRRYVRRCPVCGDSYCQGAQTFTILHATTGPFGK